MRQNCFRKISVFAPIVFRDLEALTTEAVSVDGRVVSRSVYVVDKLSERFQNLSPLDFCLENMLSAGMDLKEFTLDDSRFVAVASLPVVNHPQTVFTNEKSSLENS